MSDLVDRMLGAREPYALRPRLRWAVEPGRALVSRPAAPSSAGNFAETRRAGGIAPLLPVDVDVWDEQGEKGDATGVVGRRGEGAAPVHAADLAGPRGRTDRSGSPRGDGGGARPRSRTDAFAGPGGPDDRAAGGIDRPGSRRPSTGPWPGIVANETAQGATFGERTDQHRPGSSRSADNSGPGHGAGVGTTGRDGHGSQAAEAQAGSLRRARVGRARTAAGDPDAAEPGVTDPAAAGGRSGPPAGADGLRRGVAAGIAGLGALSDDALALRPPAPGTVGPRRRQGADQTPTTVHITIGRLELRAPATPNPTGQPRRSAPNRPTVPLEDYLRRRSGGLR